MNNLIAHIDYICFTVHDVNPDIPGHWLAVMHNWFRKTFIDAKNLGYGGLGYRKCLITEIGARLYYDPALSGDYHCHVQLPSRALKFVTDAALFTLLDSLEFFKVTRLDLAIDGTNMTPKKAYDCLQGGCVRWKGDRSKITWIDRPNELQEDGLTVGCQTIYAGTRKSGRLLRIYNKHGFNRIELEIRSKYADKVYRDIKWYQGYLHQFVGKIRDYIDFYTEPYNYENPPLLHPDWIHKVWGKSGQKLWEKQEITTLEKAKAWFNRQAGPWLKVISEVDPEFLENLIENAELKNKHQRVITLYNAPDTLPDSDP